MELGKEVISFEIRKAAQSGEWSKVENLCSGHRDSLSDPEISSWIRSRYMLGDFEGCNEISKNALRDNPRNAIALRFTARSVTKLGLSILEAKECWEAVLALEPEDLEAMNNIARFLAKEGKFEKASEMVLQILDSDPSYRPALTTLENIGKQSNESQASIINSTNSNYRSLYSEGKYSRLLQTLGYPNDAPTWSEDECTFALRALSRLGNHRDLVKIFSKLSNENQGSPRIISELASSARELGEKKIEKDAIKKLSTLGHSDKSAAIHYSRQVVYFEQDDDTASSEIEKLLKTHDDEILPSLIRLILKSKRFSLFSEVPSFGGAKSLLNPYTGRLINSLGKNEYHRILSELSPNISQAIELDRQPSNASIGRFFQTCDDLDIPYLIPEAYSLPDEKFPTERLVLSTLSKSELERYCDRVKSHSIDIGPIGRGEISKLFCSKMLNLASTGLDGKSSILSICEGRLPTGSETILSDGEPVKYEEFSILVDPRETLGRFFHLLDGMKSIDKLVVAWIARMIFNNPPEVVYYDSSLGHGRIAATLMGYGGQSLREVD